jgi:hypothetical protein
MGDHPFNVSFNRNVRSNETCVLTESTSKLLSFVLPPSGDNHSRAFLHEESRGAFADAARGSSDDRYFSV